MKKLLAITLMLCTFCLSSCGMLKKLKSGMNEAIVIIKDFCSALSHDDLDTAKSYLHPESTPSADEFSAFISKLEQTHNIDFSSGVTLKRRTGIRSVYHDSKYDGSVHEMKYETSIGDIVYDFYFIVVKNDNGYGIYNFGVEK